MDLASARVDNLGGLLQAARFSIVGIANTLIDAAFFFALAQALAFHPLPAKWISYSAGLANSYYWNRRWTFQTEGPVRQAALRYAAVNLVGLLANAGLLTLALNTLHMPLPLAWLAATGGSWLWNFLGSKQLVFKS